MWRLIVSAVLIAVSFCLALVLGHGCHPPYVHDSGLAHYTVGVSCVVSNDVPKEEFSTLLQWCETKYTETH